MVAAVVATEMEAVLEASPDANVTEPPVHVGTCASPLLAPVTVQVRVTAPVNPPTDVTVMVDEADPPGAIVPGVAVPAIIENEDETATVAAAEVDVV